MRNSEPPTGRGSATTCRLSLRELRPHGRDEAQQRIAHVALVALLVRLEPGALVVGRQLAQEAERARRYELSHRRPPPAPRSPSSRNVRGDTNSLIGAAPPAPRSSFASSRRSRPAAAPEPQQRLAREAAARGVIGRQRLEAAVLERDARAALRRREADLDLGARAAALARLATLEDEARRRLPALHAADLEEPGRRSTSAAGRPTPGSKRSTPFQRAPRHGARGPPRADLAGEQREGLGRLRRDARAHGDALAHADFSLALPALLLGRRPRELRLEGPAVAFAVLDRVRAQAVELVARAARPRARPRCCARAQCASTSRHDNRDVRGVRRRPRARGLRSCGEWPRACRTATTPSPSSISA